MAAETWVPDYSVTRRRLVWPGGAEAHVFSAEDPDSLRGPQFEAAWCDEIGAWAKDEDTWNTMMFGLRLGTQPRVVATTTPRPSKLVKLLVKMAEVSHSRSRVVITRSATRENAANLSPGWVEEMEEAYRGSHLLPQELEGVLVEDLPGAIFSRKVIEAWRVRPEDAVGLERVVVAVDPPAGVGEKAAACGIVCAGIRAGVVYVLEDASVRGLRPLEWARRVAEVARRRGAGRIVAESNQGGEMVREMLHMAGAAEISRVKLRSATASKRDRAEPVSGMYDRGVVRHAGVFRELEDELCSFGAAEAGPSPDRVDALVWAVAELTDKPKVRPGILRL